MYVTCSGAILNSKGCVFMPINVFILIVDQYENDISFQSIFDFSLVFSLK
jgi:hypothetical protein